MAQSWTRREFVSTAGMAAGTLLLPKHGLHVFTRAFANSEAQAGGQANPAATPQSRERVPWKVQPFSLTQVRLAPGPFLASREADAKFMHSLQPDRLLHTFRLNAGLASSAEPFGGWEAPDVELRGHFVGGHYLSAAAMLYASAGDDEMKARAATMVSELSRCQEALKGGYLSAFPLEFFDRLRDRVRVWAPYYTIHKILAGHLDAYTLCGNAQALDNAEKLAGWVGRWSQPLSQAHMQRVLGTEFGGMGESLCNLYAITGKREYLGTASRFDHSAFLDPLAGRRDELKGLHVNTQIPKVIAAARRYELTGDPRFRAIAEYFWDEVTTARCYCTGGTSNGESWNTDPGVLSTELGPNSTENCCAYNMLKLTRHLYGWSGDPRYFDYYERTLFSHRLGTILPEDGAMMYYLPLASGFWKVFGKTFSAFWCCTGTGAEEFAKSSDSIYFHDADSVYVNLFVASEVNWPEKGLRLKQETEFPEKESTLLTVRAERPVELSIGLRIPSWTRNATVKLNGETLPESASPGSYLMLRRTWTTGDRIELSVPMHLDIWPMPDDRRVQAMMYGPLVLAGQFEAVPADAVYGGYGPRARPFAVPEITADPASPTGWVEPVEGKTLTFRAVGQSAPITLVPLANILREKYAVYWKVNLRRA